MSNNIDLKKGLNIPIAGTAALETKKTIAQDVAAVKPTDFKGLVACGGFSYGDVLGAGSGWARSILFNDKLKGMFKAFFERPVTSFTVT